MTTINRFAPALFATLFLLALSAQAQTPQVSTVNVTPESNRVRVAAVGEVYDLKVEVVDESGETVFEGAAAAGRQLDWKMSDSRGARVTPGTYTITVSYVTQAGKQRKRIEQVTITDGAGESSSPEPQAGSDPTPQAVGTITGAGNSGRIAKFTGTNSVGNSVLIEVGGKIGIGTGSPASKLTVIGGGPAVIGALNNVTSNTPGSGVSGTGAPGSSGSMAYEGGAGVIGQGGKGGDVTAISSAFGEDGGAGIVGTGGEGGKDYNGQPNGTGGAGVRGIGGSPNGIGVLGTSSYVAVRGETQDGIGVHGSSQGGFGVYGFSASGRAVEGSSAFGYAGHFDGKVQINGNATISSPYTLSFGSTTRQIIHLYGTTYGIGVQSSTQYYRTAGGFAWFKGGVHNNAANNAGTGGTRLMRLDASGNLYTAGSINPPSDRNLKANFSSVDTRSVLDRLAGVPIQFWNYKVEGEGVRHIGPVAQDFKTAFNLGADDKTISTVDADGVALASIQALHQMMLEKDKQIEQQGQRIEQLQAQLNQVRRTIRRGRAAKR